MRMLLYTEKHNTYVISQDTSKTQHYTERMSNYKTLKYTECGSNGKVPSCTEHVIYIYIANVNRNFITIDINIFDFIALLGL